MQNQRILMNVFPTEEYYTQEKLAVQEVNYSNNYVLVTEKERLSHNVQGPILYHRFLKTSTLEIHRRHGQKIPRPSEI